MRYFLPSLRLGLSQGEGRRVTIDTLIDNSLARTKTVDEYKKVHKYGLACHTQMGFLWVIEEIAQEIVENITKKYSAYFPGPVQLYIGPIVR